MGLRRGRLAAACAVALVASLLASVAAGAHQRRRPRTLLAVRGPIRAFAQDQGRVAWVDRKWNVRLRTLRTRKTVRLGSARPFGRQARHGIPPQIALAGARVIWTQSGGGDSLETDVFARKPGQRHVRIVGGGQADRYVGVGDGGYFGAMAGAGRTLLFSVSFYRCADPGCTNLAVPTSGEADFDGTFRVLGTSGRRRLRGAPGAFELAASGRRFAALPAADPIPTGSFPFAAPGTTVDVRDAVTARLVAQFTPPGTVRALALSGTVAAVVDESRDGTRTIERYDAHTGALLGTSAVAAGDALALSGSTVVFAVGRKIETMNARTGAVRMLATSPAPPRGLSVAGKRVAWAVNAHGRGRVLALTLG